MKNGKCNGFINILFISLIIFITIYLLLKNNKKEAFENLFELEDKQLTSGPKIDNVELNLCNKELSDEIKKENINKGIDLIYDNHYEKNIKKYIDNYVDLNYLTEKVEKINKSLFKHIHKNKKYNTDGELTFV